jgi:baseplate J-like protein
MARVVLDLDAHATVLDAAEKLASAPPGDDVTFVVASGAPLVRSAVFLDVLRTRIAPRRLSIVTTDARARSLASSVHVPAYASVAALDRHELDATERMDRARRGAMVQTRRSPAPTRPTARRLLAIVASIGAAVLLVAAVVLPTATVVVSAASQPLVADLTIKAGGGGDVPLTPLTAPISAKAMGSATGSRTEQVAAQGSVHLENKTTDDIAIPKGTVFRTGGGIQFATTVDTSLGRSVIIPPFTFLLGSKDIPVQAVAAGPGGNVGAGTINVGPAPDKYTVTNPAATTGGDSKKIPVITLDDYDAAVKRAPAALQAAAEDQLARWIAEPRQALSVVHQVLSRQTAITPANVDLVGKEVATFQIGVSGIATAYAVPDNEPKHSAVAKLGDLKASGDDVDERSATVDVKSIKITDAPDVTWSVTVHASQSKHVDPQRIGHLLAGQQVRDAQGVLGREGLGLVRLEWVPAWSPLLPLLDSRIHVDVQAPPPASP